MPSPVSRVLAIGSFGLFVTLSLGACVDNGENARQFCDRHAELLAEANDAPPVDGPTASAIEDDVEETMRDAEDATRPVRGAARDLVKAYGDVAGASGEDDSASELAEARRDLLDARREMRDACAALTP